MYLTNMSRNVDCIFPDVFSYPPSKQEIQLSSFYEQARPQVKSIIEENQFPHAFGHTTPIQQSKPAVQDVKNISNSSNSGACASPGPCTVQAGNNNVVHPPMRRVVKFPISSTHTAYMVALCVVIDSILCMSIPQTITPVLGTLWGSFLQFWLLITVVQMLTHSVYLCTPIATIGSLIHFCIVLSSTILIPESLFAKSLWVAPCISLVIVAHQSQLLCLVYSHVHNQWIYAIVGSSIVLIPMTQLILTDSNETEMVFTSCIWSTISIYTLYVFAFANNRASVLVDVTVGASPTWQLQD